MADYSGRDSHLDTSHSSGLASIALNTNLPVLKLNVPLSLTHNDIFEVFTDISRKEKFQVIEMEQTIATAVNKEPFSLKRIFMKCFPFSESGTRKGSQTPRDSPITAIRLQISVNEVKGCRKLTLKGLYGDTELLRAFIQGFRNRMHKLVKNQTNSSIATEQSTGRRAQSARGFKSQRQY